MQENIDYLVQKVNRNGVISKTMIGVVILFLLLLFHLRTEISLSWDLYQKTKSQKSIFVELITQQDKHDREILYITPVNFLFLHLFDKFVYDYRHITAKSGLRIEQFISFSRLDISEIDRMSCDFCAIVNGYLHLLKLALQSTNTTTKPKLSFIVMIKYAEQVVKHRSNFIELKCKNIAYNKTNIGSINYLADLVDQIEMRYCPFKASNLYFRNQNKNFAPPTQEMIYQVGKILQKYDTIECYLCNEVINEQISQDYIAADPVKSPMLPYFKHLMSLYYSE